MVGYLWDVGNEERVPGGRESWKKSATNWRALDTPAAMLEALELTKSLGEPWRSRDS